MSNKFGVCPQNAMHKTYRECGAWLNPQTYRVESYCSWRCPTCRIAFA